MARVERFTSQEQIPVEQAQLISPGSFPVDTSSAEALKAAGETVSTIAQKLENERKVKEELARRKRDAQDRIGITNVNAAMDDAIREYQRQIIGKPLTEHAAIRQKAINNARAVATQQDLTPEARKIADSNFNIKAAKFTDNAELANVIATNKDALIRTSKAYETALIEGDINDIDDAERLLDAQLKNMAPAEAAKFKAELEERAVKQMEDNALAAQIDKAALNPAQAIESMTAEVELRAKGKKPSKELALLSNADLEAVRDYAKSVGDKAVSDSTIAKEAAVKTVYDRIIAGDTDIAGFAQLILSDPSMTDEDKTEAVDQIKTFFTTWNSAIKDDKGEDIETSNSTRIKALRVISAVKTGRLSQDAGLELYTNIAKVEPINGIDGKQFINDIFAAAETAQNVERVRQNDILNKREKQLRDAIEKQQNILDPSIATEILKDFANIAVIELNNIFREKEFTDDEVKQQVDRLLSTFTLSEIQQANAAAARSLRLARTLKQQQDSITKIVTGLKAEGKGDEAKRIMDEAIALGIFTGKGGAIKKSEGDKKNVGVELIKRILDSIIE